MTDTSNTYRETGLANSLVAIVLAVALAFLGGAMTIAISGPDVVMNGEATVLSGIELERGGARNDGRLSSVTIAAEELDDRQRSSFEF
ncbi:MAG: hypothetical protein AAF968_10920 [Pseudomonadota bacterium]